MRPLQKFIWWSWNPKKARTHPQWREEKTYTCSECKKSFGRRGTLRNHMVTHTGKKVQKCAECGDSFPWPFILKTHMLTHSGKKPHNCTQGDFASSRAGNLRDHKKNTHSLEKPNKCKWCNYSSTQKVHLTQHLLNHSGEKPHHCKECGSSFSHATTLKKNPTSANNAVSQVLNPLISRNTWPDIQQQLTSFVLRWY